MATYALPTCYLVLNESYIGSGAPAADHVRKVPPETLYGTA
jgi:hypothetical protein